LYGVHRASYPYFNGTTQRAFDVAQATSAEVVDYLHELGIDSRLFVLAATQPADGMRFLTRAEHERLRTAAFPPAEMEARSIGWSAGQRVLYRRDNRVQDTSMQVDQETYVACYGDRYTVEVRLILVRTAAGASVRTDAVQIDLGGSAQEQRRPAHAPETEPSTGLAIQFEVTREGLLDGAGRHRFLIRLTGSTLNETWDVSAGFAELLPGLVASCDAEQRRFSARQ
jgi:hypothetical protein